MRFSDCGMKERTSSETLIRYTRAEVSPGLSRSTSFARVAGTYYYRSARTHLSCQTYCASDDRRRSRGRRSGTRGGGRGDVKERVDKSRRKERINRARPLSTHLSAIREPPSPCVSRPAPRTALILRASAKSSARQGKGYEKGVRLVRGRKWSM